MAADRPESEPAKSAPGLPGKIAPADLEALNQALRALFGECVLREPPAGRNPWAADAVVALRAAWHFLMRFEPVLTDSLHVPLMNLKAHSSR